MGRGSVIVAQHKEVLAAGHVVEDALVEPVIQLARELLRYEAEFVEVDFLFEDTENCFYQLRYLRVVKLLHLIQM